MASANQTWLNKLSIIDDKLCARVCSLSRFLCSTYPSLVVSATAAMSCTVLGLWWICVCSPRYLWTKSPGVINFSPSLSTTLAYCRERQNTSSAWMSNPFRGFFPLDPKLTNKQWVYLIVNDICLIVPLQLSL